MKTWDDLKQQITPEFIKKLCEFAEGFGYIDYVLSQSSDLEQARFNNIIFPLLLHRAIEGWNKINPCKPIQILCNCISFITDEDDPASVEWGYDNEQYEPCHLTQCELAIWDCLLEVLR